MRVSNDTLYYNAKDAAATRIIYDAVNSDLKQLGHQDTYNHTIALFAPLSYMMIRGIKVDHEALQEMKKRCEVQIDEYQIKLNALAKRPLKFASPQDCARYFYGEKGIAPYTKRNAQGGSSITCDDKALQRLAKGTSSRAPLEEARIIQRMRQLSKLKGTYLEIIFDKDGRLRCSYNTRGTRFGRLSSSKTVFETGMNMQNLPPAFQQFLVADPGCLFLSLDKRQAEWVVVAYASGDASMMQAIESGVDVHAYTASNMFGVPMDIVKKEHKDIGSETDAASIKEKRGSLEYLRPYLDTWLPRTTSLRQCGKKSNHALNYDETARMFSFINEITEKEAQTIINFYHRTYPGIKSWHGTIRGKLTTDRTLENCFGRKYHFLDRWGPDLFKSAYSYIPQSSVGELVNRAMIDVYNDTNVYTNQLELMMQVHDSIDFQYPVRSPHQIVQCVRICQRYMNPTLRAGPREFHIASDLKLGFNLGTYTPKNTSGMKEVSLDADDKTLAEQIEAYLRENEQASTQ
jgi:DNA polymerase I